MKKPRVLAGAGCLALFVLVLLVGIGFVRWGRQMPRMPPRVRQFPSPNAFDDYTAAVALMQQQGGFPPRFDPSTLSLKQQRTLIRRHQPALTRARQGFGKEYLAPAEYTPDARFHYLEGFDILGRLLVTEARVAAAEGRYTAAAQRSLDAMWFGSDLPRQAPVLPTLAGMRVNDAGAQELKVVVPHLSERDARAALGRLRAIQRRWPSIEGTWEEERYGGQVGLRMLLASGDLQMMGLVNLGLGSVGDTLMLRAYPRRWILAHHDAYFRAVIVEVRKPQWQRQEVPEPADRLSQVLTLPITLVGEQWTQAETERQLLEIALLLQIHRQRYGNYPPTLRALKVEGGPASLTDSFSGRPLLYQRQSAGFVLYSVGPDGVNNAGQPLDRQKRGDVVVRHGR